MTRKSNNIGIEMPSEDVTFDLDAFDNLINTHGVPLEHFSSLPCPIGLNDVEDSHPHSLHDNCSNGRIYTPAGVCSAFFSGNQTSSVLEDFGIMDGSTVQVTLPRFYDDTTEAIAVQTNDRFYLKDFECTRVTSEKFEHSVANFDRLLFPAKQVHALLDASGRTYTQGVDFVLEKGYIKWVGQRQPGYDPKSERGEICAIRYSYQPFFYVQRLLHDLRVTKVADHMTGETKVARMPYAVLLSREYVHENEKNSDSIRPDGRDVRGPRKGSFGSR